jgi:hypothetical protein
MRFCLAGAQRARPRAASARPRRVRRYRHSGSSAREVSVARGRSAVDAWSVTGGIAPILPRVALARLERRCLEQRTGYAAAAPLRHLWYPHGSACGAQLERGGATGNLTLGAARVVAAVSSYI